MKFSTTYEVNLFKIFAEEKMKHGDQFTISYNNKNQQLKYALEGKGVLTVKLRRDSYNDNREDFFYSPEGKPEEQIPVYQIAGNGEFTRFQDEFLAIPHEFRDLTKTYADKSERDRMGIEMAQAAAKKHKRLTFGER